jgi:hypothetical protein
METAVNERRRGGDRRDPAGHGAPPAGIDRRRGPRRRPFPRSRWADAPAIVLALILGVATAVIAQPGRARPGIATSAWIAEARALPIADAVQALAAASTIRDEAEALTPAALALDELELERWLHRAAAIEAQLADPRVLAPVRRELEAALVALDARGVIDRGRR